MPYKMTKPRAFYSQGWYDKCMIVPLHCTIKFFQKIYKMYKYTNNFFYPQDRINPMFFNLSSVVLGIV